MWFKRIDGDAVHEMLTLMNDPFAKRITVVDDVTPYLCMLEMQLVFGSVANMISTTTVEYSELVPEPATTSAPPPQQSLAEADSESDADSVVSDDVSQPPQVSAGASVQSATVAEVDAAPQPVIAPPTTQPFVNPFVNRNPATEVTMVPCRNGVLAANDPVICHDQEYTCIG